MAHPHAKAVGGTIRTTGQAELATKADLRAEIVRLDRRIEGVSGRISSLQWVVAVHFAIGSAMLAAVLEMAFRT